MAEPEGVLLTGEAGLARPWELGQELVELGPLAALAERPLQLVLAVEMVLDGSLVAPGDEDEMLDAGGFGFVDHVLNRGTIDDGQHLLRDSLGGRQEARAEPGYGKDGLADALLVAGHAHLCC